MKFKEFIKKATKKPQTVDDWVEYIAFSGAGNVHNGIARHDVPSQLRDQIFDKLIFHKNMTTYTPSLNGSDVIKLTWADGTGTMIWVNNFNQFRSIWYERNHWVP